jgi:hypothetical protein
MTNLPVRSRSPTALNHHDELVRTKSDPVEEEESATEKDNGQEEAESPSPADSMMDAATTVTPKGSYRNPSHRSGRWTLDEKILFLYGLQKFGKGRWKKMSVYLPNRYVSDHFMYRLLGLTAFTGCTAILEIRNSKLGVCIIVRLTLSIPHTLSL